MNQSKICWNILDADGGVIAVDPGTVIETMTGFSEKARREGLLALEEDLEGMTPVLQRRLLQLIVDGVDPNIVTSIGISSRCRLLSVLGEIYACIRLVCENTDRPELEAIFAASVRTRNLTNLAGHLDAIKEWLVQRLHNTDTALPGDGENDVLRLFVEIAHMPVTAGERERFYDALVATALREADCCYELMYEGVLAIQSGVNPRIVREKLCAIAGIVVKEEQQEL